MAAITYILNYMCMAAYIFIESRTSCAPLVQRLANVLAC